MTHNPMMGTDGRFHEDDWRPEDVSTIDEWILDPDGRLIKLPRYKHGSPS
jgi:hypothetical protein